MSKPATHQDETVENLFGVEDGVETLILDAEETPITLDKKAIAARVAEKAGLPGAQRDWAATLDAPLDLAAVKTRKGAGGTELSYLEWHYITRQLNRIIGYGNWETEITETKFLGGDVETAPRGVLVRMKLSVTFQGMADYEGALYPRTVTFENTGYAPNSRGSWDMLEMAVGAATQTAFKRCATALGDQFGLSLYEKDKTEEATTGSASPTPQAAAPSSPVPSSGASPLQYIGQSSFDCQDCGRSVTGYASAKTGKSYTTQDLWDMSIKQTGGLYCFNCKLKHAKR